MDSKLLKNEQGMDIFEFWIWDSITKLLVDFLIALVTYVIYFNVGIFSFYSNGRMWCCACVHCDEINSHFYPSWCTCCSKLRSIALACRMWHCDTYYFPLVFQCKLFDKKLHITWMTVRISNGYKMCYQVEINRNEIDTKPDECI